MKKKQQSLSSTVPTLTGLVFILITLFSIVFYFFVINRSTLLRTDAREPQRTSLSRKFAMENIATQEIPLTIGWNFISAFVFNDWYANDVCNASNEVVTVARHINDTNTFEEYDCANPATVSFRITPNVGYFIRAEKSTTISTTGTVIPYFTDVNPGYNSIGLSTEPGYPAKASDLCGNYRGTNLEIVEVNRWYNGGWSAHVCGKPFNKFDLRPGVGYLIKAQVGQEILNINLPSLGQ